MARVLVIAIVFANVFLNVNAKSLVLIGGSISSDNSAVWERIVELAGGRGSAKIGIVTASSSDPLDSYLYYKDLFENTYGVQSAEWIEVHLGAQENNKDPEVISTIYRQTGFFFGGGDQSRVIESFYDDGNPNRIESPAMAAIRDVYNNGAVIAGTSAGTAVQPTPVMMAGGRSWDAVRYGAYELGTEIGSNDLVYNPEGGIGMLDGFIPDSHFSERGREGRLIRLLSDTRNQNFGATRGIGVDENTALVITNVGTPFASGTVLGEWGVIWIDISDAEVVYGNYWGIRDVVVHQLTEHDVINLFTGMVTFANWKTDLTGREWYNYAYTSNDIFSSKSGNTAEFSKIAESLFDSKYSTTTTGTTDEKPRFTVRMSKLGEGAVGYQGYSPTHGQSRVSYINMLVDIYES